MKTVYDLIIEPLITEKGAQMQKKDNKFLFKVRADANKREIRSAIEKIFNVHVERINTQWVKGRLKRVRHEPGYTADWKKAIVTLKKGESLNLT